MKKSCFFMLAFLMLFLCSCTVKKNQDDNSRDSNSNTIQKKPETVIVKTCPDGYINNGTNCEKENFTEPQIIYYCNEGGVLNGTMCTYTRSTPAYTIETCPDESEGITSDGKCWMPSYAQGNWVYKCYGDDKYIPILYDKKCYFLLGSDSMYENTGATCIRGPVTSNGIIRPTNYCNYYSVSDAIKELECPVGYSRYLYSNDTRMCRYPRTVNKTIKKYCINGYLSGNNCIETVTTAAGYRYQCETGILIEGFKCYEKLYADFIN